MNYRAREWITFGYNFNVLFLSQLLAALRAIVDIDLNFNQTPEITVLDMYNEYVWEDNTDLAKKDVLRSQSVPGYVTSYMIGQMEISRVRGIAERELGRNFNLEEFHYELLRQGEFPLRYLEEHIRDYVTCKKDPTIEGCKEFWGVNLIVFESRLCESNMHSLLDCAITKYRIATNHQKGWE